MQNLDVISINLWQMLISLCNLLILYLIMKKFLYAPVRRVISERESALERCRAQTEKAMELAEQDRLAWQEKMKSADEKGEEIIKHAEENAKIIGDELLGKAKENADNIVNTAKKEALKEKKKAQDEIKKEIADLSFLMAEKVLERQINSEDHRTIIESAIEKMGDNDE